VGAQLVSTHGTIRLRMSARTVDTAGLLPTANTIPCGRLVQNGTFLAVVTRRNWITKILIERWWHAARYTRQELREAFAAAGFYGVQFIKFPLRYFWLNTSNHVVVARRVE